jgi:integrase
MREQTGSIEQLRSGKWSYRARDEHGKQVRKSGFKSERDAMRALVRFTDEVAAIRRGEFKRPEPAREIPTFEQIAEDYLAQYEAEANTLKTFKQRLSYSRKKFGSVRIDQLDADSIARWYRTLPPGSAAPIIRAMGQPLNFAVRTGRLDKNPVTAVKLKNAPPPEIEPFTMEELAAIDAELPKHLRGVATFAALTAMRPSEWIALERGDIDRAKVVIHARRTYRDGELREGRGKTRGSIRTVPLPKQALAILDARPARLDTRLVWPGARGEHLNLNDFRRTWKTALTAAGVKHRTIYSLRHTGISMLLAAGVSSFEAAKLAGTSVAMIERTYGRLLTDSHDRARTALDALLSAQEAAAEK